MGAGKNIIVERLGTQPVGSQRVEFVERKGLGHPDFIADAIAEEVSRELCKFYIERYGSILHHNVDKVLVVGGQSAPTFGGGEVLAPIYVLVAGRATTSVKTQEGFESVPIGPIVLKAAKNWLGKSFRYLNPESHVIVDYRIGSGSADLVSIFQRSEKYPGANDTSLGVGFAPLTDAERLVLEVERLLNSRKLKSELPMVGEDVKVMGLRRDREIDLTIAVAMVSRHVANRYEYIHARDEIIRRVREFAGTLTDMDVRVHVNTGDNTESEKPSDYYLVVTGTSAEHGDDGATGRGNRANGLITPMRPMSMEAAAGKNPVNHVGKLYNIIANRIAGRIVEETPAVEAYVKLLSQIGRPINDPLAAYVGILTASAHEYAPAARAAEEIVVDELDRIIYLKEELLRGEITVF